MTATARRPVVSRERPAERGPSVLRTVPFLLVTVAVYVATQVSMLLSRPDFDLRQFRAYFPTDQLSYMAIVVEGSQGRFDFAEPFTRTGLDYYPHAYYLLLGLVSWLTPLDPLQSWTVVGLAVQVVLVAGVGLCCARFTGRAWTAVLGAGPFLVGTFAALRGPGWYHQLDGHAVTWGAYGVFFPLNGEAAGLTLGILGLLALASAALRPEVGRPLVRATLGAVAIGLAGDVQTYSFLTAAYVGFYVAATYGLLARRARWTALGSVVLLVLLFVVGGAARGGLGPLAVLVLGLVPAVPGLVVLLREVGARLLVPVAAFAVAAAPQVLWTARGIVVGEPFLLYRQDSSSTQQLGVPLREFAVAGGVVLVALVVVLLIGVHRRHVLWTAYPVGAAVAWFLVGENDRWGASQEPYRLWIDAFAVLAFVTLPIGCAAVGAAWSRARPADDVPADGVAADDVPADGVAAGDAGSGRSSRASGRTRALAAAGVVVVLGLGVASLGDWWRFWHATKQIGFLTYFGPRADALRTVLAGHGDQLVLTDTCLSQFDVKIATGGRVAFYNYGMAWPDHEPAMATTLAARGAGTLDATAARAAGVQTVLTTSTCPDGWPQRYGALLRPVATAAYTDAGGPATLTLWEWTS